MNLQLFSHKSKTFDEILPSFLEDMRISMKPKSYLVYPGKTKVFSEWLAENSLSNLRIKDIDSETVAKFFRHLATQRNLERPTCEKYFLVLRSIWKWAIVREYAKTEPFERIVYPPKGASHGAQVISPEDGDILFEDIRQNNKQLYLAVMTEYYTCLRPGRELRLLKLSEMDFINGTITVLPENAKTGKRRIVTMPQQYRDLCEEYQLDSYDKSLYVFGNNKQGVPGDSPWSENMMGWRFRQFRDKLGMSKGYSLYSPKHTGLTRLHRAGVPLLDTMEQAGHSSIKAHQSYLHQHTGTINETIRLQYPSASRKAS